jgi:hypothetical protein
LSSVKPTTPRTRVLHKIEAYSKLFYKEKHKQFVDENVGPRLDNESEKDFAKRRFTILKDAVTKGLEEATDEELAAVDEFMEKQQQDRDAAKLEEDVDESATGDEVTVPAEQYLECAWLCKLMILLHLTLPYDRALDALPVVLKEVFQALCSETGWSFTVLMGGPHPRLHGEIATMRYVISDFVCVPHTYR